MPLKTLPMSQPEPPLLGSNVAHVTHENMNKPASPSDVVADLPSWTPLRTLGNDEDSSASDPEIDELSTRKATDSTMQRQFRVSPTKTRATTVEDTVTAGRAPKSSSDAKPSGLKKARFDGIVITTKPPLRRGCSPPSQTRRGSAPASNAQAFSLVDALARTFDANKHVEDPFPHHSRTASRQRDNASTAPPTDAETTTEAEDEQLWLSARLARKPLKRPLARAIAVSANTSETNSEDAASVVQDVPPTARPVKRLKQIQYESNPNLIDAALRTVQASISWDAELDFITRDEGFVIPAQITHVTPADAWMIADEGDHAAGTPGKHREHPSTRVQNKRRVPTWGAPERAVMTPYLSRGAKFRQRLEAMFGENATVRTDRVARPKPIEYDFYVPFDEPDREASPNSTESAISASSVSVAEEAANAISSTHITSQSPDMPLADTPMDALPRNELDEADALTMSTFDAGEEQLSGWITALQRLIKGKVTIKEEDLEMLSIILAEIESVKDNLDEDASMTSELRESIKQLSELNEIPFGDRNKLRRRAKNISHTWPPMGKPGAS